MTEAQFLDACERILAAIEDALDRDEGDIQTSRQGNVLEIEFDDDSKIVVNGHAPLREIWVAARAGGFHFKRSDDGWRDSRSGAELFEALSRLVSEQSGTPVRLTPA